MTEPSDAALKPCPSCGAECDYAYRSDGKYGPAEPCWGEVEITFAAFWSEHEDACDEHACQGHLHCDEGKPYQPAPGPVSP